MKEELRSLFGDSVSSKRLIKHNREYYNRACSGELTRIGPKTWDLRSSTNSNVVQVMEPSKATVRISKDRYDEIAKRFSMLKILGNGVVSGNIRALIVAGAPGVGKTYELQLLLDEALNKQMIHSSVEVKGTLSAIVLYKTLYENKDKGQVIVLDDVDRIYGDEESMNILKAALDSSVTRTISWGKASRFLEDEGIPNKFEYCGQVIFITNVNIDKVIAKEGRMSPHLSALVSRSTFLDLCIHEADEIIMRIEQVLKGSDLISNLQLLDEQVDSIIHWLKVNSSKLRSVSIRTVLQLASLIKTTPNQWEDIAEATLIKRY